MFDINNVCKRVYVYTRKQSFQPIPGSGSARRPSRLLCISSANAHKYSHICTARIGIHLLHIIIIGVRFAKTIFFPTQSPVLKLHIYIYHTPNVRMVLRARTSLFYIFSYIHTGVQARDSKAVSKIVGMWVAEFRERGVNPCPSN